MISQKMEKLVKGSSVIRQMFEEGKKMAAEFGAENVYDFSLGNPNVPAPTAVNESMIDIIEHEDTIKLHGYMSNSGYEEVREAIANHLNGQYGTGYNVNNVVMTVGAAGGLNVCFRSLLDEDDEVIVFAPYFSEYNNYIANFNGKPVVVSPDTSSFQPKLDEFETKITSRTKAVIVNSPNNPTGVIYSEDTLKKMADILEKKQKEFGTSIYLITDEPYRELAYDGAIVPWVPSFYRNTIVGYSYSKSLSLPGERIGYLIVPSDIDDYEDVFAAFGIATRILGFVNAPSLQQLTIARCLNEKTDISYYDRNRETLYKGLLDAGFTCQKPEGAFYLFVKSPFEDDSKFVAMAKKYHLLIVPGSSFACPGYVRIAYCVSYETIVNSLPKFKELAEECGIGTFEQYGVD